MNGLFFLNLGRWPAGGLKGLLLGWLLSEVLAFCVAVKLLGLGGTLLLGLLTSVIGMAMLRRVGLDAARQLSRTMTAPGGSNDAFVDGTLTALGAILLILPGFVSDAVGLVLASPSIRQGIAARVLARDTGPAGRPMQRRPEADVIDLSPEDWRVVDKTGRV